jgi:dihydrofolate reductase
MTMRLVVLNHISLDGVMQSPGRADEDTRSGFRSGGWAVPYNDEVMNAALGERMAQREGALLFGRRTYEDLLESWNKRGGPFKGALNSSTKYVASSSAATQLEWPNSTLLHGDVPSGVGRLKREGEGTLTVMGSGKLIHSLLPHGLIDEFFLLVYPLLLGAGLRLFPNTGTTVPLRLERSMATTKGVMIATYTTKPN